MDPDVAPEPEKTKAPRKNLFAPLKNLSTPFKNLLTLFKNLAGSIANLAAPLENLAAPLRKLPIPKKLVIPAIAGAVLLVAGGAAFGVLHAKSKHAAASQSKAVVSQAKGVASSAPVASTTVASCSGVVRDIYRQTVDEDPSVTLADVRSEVQSSGVSCAPVPAIAAELKDLSPACRDMVQYTYLGLHDSHSDIKVSDIREKVVPKSVACEHDRGRQT